MAKSNGKLSEKRVADWFTAMDFDGQQATLAKLSDLHGSVKEDKIRALRQELAQLEGGGSSISGRKKMGTKGGHSVGNGRKKTRSVQAKYRDPKSGEAWSGRGRMARWLAEKVANGEKADKYLV